LLERVPGHFGHTVQQNQTGLESLQILDQDILALALEPRADKFLYLVGGNGEHARQYRQGDDVLAQASARFRHGGLMQRDGDGVVRETLWYFAMFGIVKNHTVGGDAITPGVHRFLVERHEDIGFHTDGLDGIGIDPHLHHRQAALDLGGIRTEGKDLPCGVRSRPGQDPGDADHAFTAFTGHPHYYVTTGHSRVSSSAKIDASQVPDV
jgi:hypothetical protein